MIALSQIFVEIISFSSFLEWIEKHLGTCYLYKIFGIQCPGCGMQRSIVELLRGELMASLKLYPATIPMFLMFVFLILHLKFKFKNGALILKVLFIFTVTIVVGKYIYKIVTNNIY